MATEAQTSSWSVHEIDRIIEPCDTRFVAELPLHLCTRWRRRYELVTVEKLGLRFSEYLYMTEETVDRKSK